MKRYDVESIAPYDMEEAPNGTWVMFDDAQAAIATARAQALDEAYAAVFDAVFADGHGSERSKLLAFDLQTRLRNLKERTPATADAAQGGVATLPPFEQEWAKKEAAGYQYGRDALAQVRFGYRIAQEALAAAAPQRAEPERATAERELMAALRLFLGAACPVSTDIDPRGYRWSEAYLDQARAAALTTAPAAKEPTMSENLKTLLARCKCGVYLTVNEHRASYDMPAQRLAEWDSRECPPEISDDVRAGILSSGNIVELQFYPDTPVGFYTVVHYDIDEALRLALHLVAQGV